ncbi:hypothetical protein [Noviherbaspirillum galbum]|uniref:Uncharacterized protein n=1 Tax=Noviherbaspirillum galbum TaxID=2709383 RepID=A0A6B3SP93_9BURK|nr:hypothetical protein [Noviherbaspirillum galbum]NEX62567.1 hypothetical protein [Noviherbaspirillum galbum]
MVTAQCDKIDIARILIERIDGVVAKARVSTLALANGVLERWASDAPEKGEGRCEIQIIFEDGFRYHGRIGLKRSQKRISLARHLRQQFAELARPQPARGAKKAAEPEPENHAMIHAANPSVCLALEDMLARYDI